jgi:hypothetical protein
MKSIIYHFLVWFANFFAVTFRQEVTVFDRLASLFEPKKEQYFKSRFVQGHHGTRLHSINANKSNVR